MYNKWAARVCKYKRRHYLPYIKNRKAHGCNNISVRMIQLGGKAIVKPLQILIFSFSKMVYIWMTGRKVA